ncbi:MAG: acyl-CoA reductase [Verrucomicrobiales bacterium]
MPDFAQSELTPEGSTWETAKLISQAAAQFAYLLGPLPPEDLMGLVEVELGHSEILERFCAYRSFKPPGHDEIIQYSRAQGPQQILHILSGNTPHAALQSLIRGLLLGAHNLCKIPARGLPEVQAFRDALPAPLCHEIEITENLPDEWLKASDAVIVFGNDETIEHFQRHVRPDQIFIAHGHRLSFAVVFEDPHRESLPLLARDVALFEQQGCLSPHVVYVKESFGLDAPTYAQELAWALEDIAKELPPKKMSEDEAAFLMNLRTSYRFKAANYPDQVALHVSEGSTDWTVVYEKDPLFSVSALNRFITVKPLPVNLAGSIAQVRKHLSAVGIYPATAENANLLARYGISRICGIGKMQEPFITWHQDGQASLAPLVRWVDYEHPVLPPSFRTAELPLHPDSERSRRRR